MRTSIKQKRDFEFARFSVSVEKTDAGFELSGVAVAAPSREGTQQVPQFLGSSPSGSVAVHRLSAGMAVHLDGTGRDMGQNAACISPWS